MDQLVTACRVVATWKLWVHFQAIRFCGRYRNVNHRVWLWQIVMTNIHRLRRGKHFMGIRSHVRTDHVFAFHRIIRVVTRHLPNHHAA
ncbi:Uncharacterised protein [Vibrio cholerae]|nr:Uncharacterised protein [Vibrio cholerae]